MASRRHAATASGQAPRGWSTSVVEGRKDDREQDVGVSVPPTPSHLRSKKEGDLFLFFGDDRRWPAVVELKEEGREEGRGVGRLECREVLRLGYLRGNPRITYIIACISC